MAQLGTEEAYTIARELSTILPEVTSSPHILNMVARLCSLLEPYKPSDDSIQDTVVLDESIKRFEEQIAEAKKERDKAKELAQEEFLERGISQAKVNGKTLYQHRTIRAAIPVAKMEEACTAIIEHADSEEPGPTHLVKFTINAQSLTSWVREQPRDDEDKPVLPKWLVPFLTLHLGYEMRVRG